MSFVRDARARAEPVLVAVSADDARLIRSALGEDGEFLVFRDMAELGRNPARITLALNAFAARHAGERFRCVTEPMWRGRTGAETAEVMRHEALVNLALAEVPAQLLCLYDASWLGPALMAEVRRAHPVMLVQGDAVPSPDYQETDRAAPVAELPAPPSWAQSVAYTSELRTVRALVRSCAESSGLPPARCADLVLAVGEITANTLGHTQAGGTVHVWVSEHQILCQIHDEGWITDPLAGRRSPPPQSRGHGLQVVNEVCDLLEMRTGPAGTTFRIRMRLPGG
jgi:anti-sigma regulatory factor (Ser/Thr protein kinase)